MTERDENQWRRCKLATAARRRSLCSLKMFSLHFQGMESGVRGTFPERQQPNSSAITMALLQCLWFFILFLLSPLLSRRLPPCHHMVSIGTKFNGSWIQHQLCLLVGSVADWYVPNFEDANRTRQTIIFSVLLTFQKDFLYLVSPTMKCEIIQLWWHHCLWACILSKPLSLGLILLVKQFLPFGESSLLL